jgi:hypothetical protein
VQLTVEQNHDPIADRERRKAMRDHEHGHAGRECGHRLTNEAFGLDVQ